MEIRNDSISCRRSGTDDLGIPLFPAKPLGEPFMTSPTSGTTVGLDAAGSGVGKGSASITNIPPAISNSIVDFAYSVGDRLVRKASDDTP